MEPEVDVLINGWFGPNNAGDEAILSEELSLLDQYNASVVVAAADPDAVERRHSVSAIPEYRDDPAQWKQVAVNMDHIIIGGGGLIESQNIAGKWSAVVSSCHNLGIPVHFIGVGVTPPISRLHKQLYVDTLNYSTSIVVRDNISRQRLLDLGVTRAISVKPDIAFHHSKTDPPTGSQPNTDRLLVVLRDVPWLDVDIDGLSAAVNRHCERVDCTVEVAEFAGKAADQVLIDEFVQKIEHDIKKSRAVNFHELEKIVATSRYVIGMRLHSIIFAAKHGIPFLSIAYNPKCQNVPSQFGYPNVNWCVNVDSKSVADKITDSWVDDELRHQLAAAARDQHNKVSTIFECLQSNTKQMTPFVRYRMGLLAKMIQVENYIRKSVGAQRAPAPQSVVPEDTQQLTGIS